MPNKGTSEAARLREILSAVYERRKDEARVSPSWLATEAMTELDPDREAPPLVYLGCHLELRQIAREFCRKRFEPEDDGEAHDLFPDLQARYPTARSSKDDPEYVKLEFLNRDDIAFNVNRLRSEAAHRLAHADALEEYGELRAA
ncbi:hypothetical protein M8037_35345 [Sinorhizobium meliloti]|uniref:hypothetical protein n=1 Tax=Rhizobium meliloti TaxID=382 RepID=UPI002073B1D1|nr:hypothetical protein [Sinorhizobium meliloti]MCM5693917.1 hypothetical protein [Sinorhizobium meliloti]